MDENLKRKNLDWLCVTGKNRLSNKPKKFYLSLTTKRTQDSLFTFRADGKRFEIWDFDLAFLSSTNLWLFGWQFDFRGKVVVYGYLALHSVAVILNKHFFLINCTRARTGLKTHRRLHVEIR